MTVEDQPAGRNADKEHSKSFFEAVKEWSRRVRQARLTGQALKVAWAISERFGITHGVAYEGRESLAVRSGVGDTADVRKALKALADAHLIEAVPDAQVLAALRQDGKQRPSGRPPRGYRMIVDRDAPRFLETVEEIVMRAEPLGPDVRVGRKRAPRKWQDANDFGGTAPPSQNSENGGVSGEQRPSTSEGTVPPEFRGSSAPPKIREADEEGGGAYAPTPHIDNHFSYERDAHAPEGARPQEDKLMNNEEALDQIIRAFGGPIGDRDLAFAAMMTAIDEGTYHDQLVHVAAHHDDPTQTLSDLLWRQTERGRRDAQARRRSTLSEDDDNYIPF